MSVVFIAIIATIVAVLLGTGIGGLLQRYFSSTQLDIELAALKNKDRSGHQFVDHGQAALLIARLAELTTGVADEVGKHSGNIEAINAELVAAQDADANSVVTVVKKILQANQQMQRELRQAETRLQDQHEELIAQTEAARVDPLTKIINRRGLDEELKKCMLEFRRSAEPFCVMVLDVDDFKKFNDTHGHLAGDEVLRFVAQSMKNQVRPSEYVARYGGEEFVVVFRGETIVACRDRADRIRASINQQSITFEGKELRVAASAGIAEIGMAEDEKGLIRRADEALYISKKAGRNCAHWNDGRQNLPITPEFLAKTAATSPAGLKDLARVPGDRRITLHELRFSDASFSSNLDRRVAEWKRTGHSFSVAVCAIDHVAQLRASFGDEMLQKIITGAASVVGSCLRDMDQIVTYGEGSFAISLPTAHVQIAAQVGERVRKAIEGLYVPTGILPQFTLSVGVAEVIDGNDASRLFERAQRALEAAQAASSNCTYLHDGLHVVPALQAARQPAMAQG